MAKRKRLKNGEASDLPRRTKRHRSSDEAITGGREEEEECEEELESSDQEGKRLEEAGHADKTHKTQGICVTVKKIPVLTAE